MVADSSASLPARARRFVARNWRPLLLDTVVVFALVVFLALAFQWFNWPTWAYYTVLLAAVAAYSFVSVPWRT